AKGSRAETGARLERTPFRQKRAMASCRASRPDVCTGKKLVTLGGVDTLSPCRAIDKLPRVAQEPLGVPGGPAVGPLFGTVYSRIVDWSAPVSSMPPIT